jgi:hypothetical protein
MTPLLELPDPRRWPAAAAASPAAQELYARVAARLALTAAEAGERIDARIDDALAACLRAGDGARLAAWLAGAPAADVYRHLWRRLAMAEAAALTERDLAIVLFALPLVVVAARDAAGEAVSLPATVDAPAIGAALRDNGLVAADARIALSSALVGADALDPAALPALCMQARALLDGVSTDALDLAATAIAVDAAHEAAHLRFLVGYALCAPRADPLQAVAQKAGALALSRLLSGVLAVSAATVLVLPGPPRRLVPALAAGRSAQRQVALDLFAGNALRALRARYGEPTAVISAHEAPDAIGGGELRLALSSPFSPRDAEGFRYPLEPYERIPDAVNAIATLLADCRVTDVRAMPGIQPDRDPATGLRRFCRGEDVARMVH